MISRLKSNVLSLVFLRLFIVCVARVSRWRGGMVDDSVLERERDRCV